MSVEVVLIGLVFGWLRGGKLSRLSELELAYPGLIIMAFLIQSVMAYLPLKAIHPWAPFYLLLLSYLLMLVALARSRFTIGIGLAAAGVFANFLVILLNGGMPVSLERIHSLSGRGLTTISDGIHTPLTSASKLPWLADVILQPLLWRSLISVGDIILAMGVFMIIQQGMVNQLKTKP